MVSENKNMNHKPEIEIKIYGGTNMIAPVATTAVQNFYGDRFAEVALHAEGFDASGLSDASEVPVGFGPSGNPDDSGDFESLSDTECQLFTYVPDVKKVREYVRLLGDCATAHDLAGVVGIKVDNVRQRR